MTSTAPLVQLPFTLLRYILYVYTNTILKQINIYLLVVNQVSLWFHWQFYPEILISPHCWRVTASQMQFVLNIQEPETHNTETNHVLYFYFYNTMSVPGLQNLILALQGQRKHFLQAKNSKSYGFKILSVYSRQILDIISVIIFVYMI